MALDVHICGAGFGEMILLRWREGSTLCAGLIDCYSNSSNVRPLIRWLTELGVERLAFIAVTHPHLDHLLRLDQILAAFSGRVDYLWVWPGVEPVKAMIYFKKLAKEFPNSPNMLGRRANAVMALFDERKHQFFDLQLGKPILGTLDKLTRIYPTLGATKLIEFICVSPWDTSIIRFTEMVNLGLTPNSQIQDIHGDANLVSAGFVVNYGSTQILLGGDMEDDNWRSLTENPNNPLKNPSVVKVSHHGSPTGTIPGMWGKAGFLGQSCKIAVITPWNKKLPVASVLEEINSSGCSTYLTGQSPLVRDNLSNIHIRLFEDNSPPEVISKSNSVKLLT